MTATCIVHCSSGCLGGCRRRRRRLRRRRRRRRRSRRYLCEFVVGPRLGCLDNKRSSSMPFVSSLRVAAEIDIVEYQEPNSRRPRAATWPI